MGFGIDLAQPWPRRGLAGIAPGVAVAMAASRAKASCNCCNQPGDGTLSGASTATSGPSQARSISSRWATSPSGRARRVYSACSGVCANQCSTTACARGPACASSASQTAVPGAVPHPVRPGSGRARHRPHTAATTRSPPSRLRGCRWPQRSTGRVSAGLHPAPAEAGAEATAEAGYPWNGGWVRLRGRRKPILGLGRGIHAADAPQPDPAFDRFLRSASKAGVRSVFLWKTDLTPFLISKSDRQSSTHGVDLPCRPRSTPTNSSTLSKAGTVGLRGVSRMDAATKPHGWVYGVPANPQCPAIPQ